MIKVFALSLHRLRQFISVIFVWSTTPFHLRGYATFRSACGNVQPGKPQDSNAAAILLLQNTKQIVKARTFPGSSSAGAFEQLQVNGSRGEVFSALPKSTR